MLRPFPIFLIGLALTACVKVAKVSKAKMPLTTLAGSEWQPEITPNLTSGSEQFIAFKTGGEVMGHGGCNRFFGSYTLSGDALVFGPLASTKMACPDMAAENEFMAALNSARTIEATHLRLILKGEDGAPVLSLRRRDWD